MRLPLTDRVIEEAKRFELRSACCHCFFYVAREDRCAHDWPIGEQRRWPLDRPDDATGERPATFDLCKEFELR